MWQRDSQGEVIALDAALSRRERRCALAHELIHAERGIGCGLASPATMEREEDIVRKETARRLVPLDMLETFITCHGEVGAVTAWSVGEEFDVTEEVGALALVLASQRRRSVRRR